MSNTADRSNDRHSSSPALDYGRDTQLNGLSSTSYFAKAAECFAPRQMTKQAAIQPYVDAHTHTRTEASGFGLLLSVAGLIAMAASPFLPWLSFLGTSLSLNEIRNLGGPSGLFTEILVIAGIGGAGWLLRLTRVLNVGAARVCAVVVGGAGLIEVATAHSRLESGLGVVSFGVGFYILAAGSIAVIAGAFLDRD